jgi:antitoxin PrlF
MGYALTSKSQVTIPKAVRQALGIGPGQEVDYEVQPGGKVLIVPVERAAPANVDLFQAWRGVGILKRGTADILSDTRGDDCMR